MCARMHDILPGRDPQTLGQPQYVFSALNLLVSSVTCSSMFGDPLVSRYPEHGLSAPGRAPNGRTKRVGASLSAVR